MVFVADLPKLPPAGRLFREKAGGCLLGGLLLLLLLLATVISALLRCCGSIGSSIGSGGRSGSSGKKIMSKSGFVTLAFIHFVTVRCVFV